MKTCNNCGCEKDETEFNFKSVLKGTRQSHCRSCQQTYKNNHYKLNRDRYLNRSKIQNEKYKIIAEELVAKFQEQGCSVCGEKCSACLDAHHIDPDIKDFDIARGIWHKLSIERIKTELAKCVCLCSNCHRKLHAGIV